MDPFIGAVNQNANTCSTIVLSSSSLNDNQKQVAIAFPRQDSPGEHFFREADIKNSVGLLFKAVYLGNVSLKDHFSFNKLPLETRVELVKSCTRQVRKALLCVYGDGDLLQSDSPNENISQYLGQVNVVRGSETAIVSLTNKHLTIILSPSADRQQFSIEKVSFANSNPDGYFAFVAKNKDLNRICLVLKSEHSYLLVKALSQV